MYERRAKKFGSFLSSDLLASKTSCLLANQRAQDSSVSKKLAPGDSLPFANRATAQRVTRAPACRMPRTSSGKNWCRPGGRSGRHLPLYRKEESAHFIASRYFVSAGSDHEIEQLRRLGPPERSGGIAMQVVEFGGDFPHQHCLTINRECADVFWGHLPNHELTQRINHC